MKHVYFYVFVGGWIFFYWCSRRGSKLSSIFYRCFKFDFKRVPQYCFKGVFLIISHFFDWPFRICLSPLVYRFTSLIEMLFIFTKKRVFECSEADLLSVFILPDLMLLVVGFRKRAVHKECLVIGNEMYSPWAAPPPPSPKKKWVFGSGWRTKQYRLLVTLGCLLPRKVWWAVWISSFWPKNEVFYRPEWTNGGTTWKWILSIFKFRSEYYKQIGKSRWKKWGHLSSLHAPFLIYGP